MMIKLVKLWVLGSAACVAAGWILSALHQLNLAGYAVSFFIFAIGLALLCQRWRRAQNAGGGVKAARWNLHRFRHPLPLVFLLMAIMATCGGALHAPNNYDALTYRFPRVLHWWAAGAWHWIASPTLRINLSGTGFEWLMMPMFVVTHSDRFFFLINIFAYLLLPTLVFVTFVAAGVVPRVARFWMWLLPAALCYAMQAGSISNDTVAVTYFLAAIYFALQARRTRNVRNLWLAFLAAGLLTGVKAANLPLLLPLAWTFWPVLSLVKKQFTGSVAIVLLSMLVSFLPMALLNQYYTGDWGGDPRNVEDVQMQKPLPGILGNSLQLGLQSLEPPFLPVARSVETWVWDRFPGRLQNVLKRNFPRFVVGFRELPQEESAGVGIGIMVMVIISVVAAVRFRRQNLSRSAIWTRRHGLTIGILTWIALLVFMSKLGSESTSRLIAAYYPLLLLPLALAPGQSFLVRRRWYKSLAVCVGMIALLAIILTPSRPLWPARRFFDWAVARFPKSELIAHARMVYAVYRHRNDLFASLRRSIPESVQVIGVIEGGDDVEASLWRPFGARRVVQVLGSDRIQAGKQQWIVVKNGVCGRKNPNDFNEWLSRTGGVLIAHERITEKVGSGPEEWSVIHFPNAPE